MSTYTVIISPTVFSPFRWPVGFLRFHRLIDWILSRRSLQHSLILNTFTKEPSNRSVAKSNRVAGSITRDQATGSFLSALSWSRDLFRFGERRVQFKLVLLMSGSLIENATSNACRWNRGGRRESSRPIKAQNYGKVPKVKPSAWEIRFERTNAIEIVQAQTYLQMNRTNL